METQQKHQLLSEIVCPSIYTYYILYMKDAGSCQHAEDLLAHQVFFITHTISSDTTMIIEWQTNI
jgi:hypothetical protein